MYGSVLNFSISSLSISGSLSLLLLLFLVFFFLKEVREVQMGNRKNEILIELEALHVLSH